jgi:hypothetical protein
MADQIVVKNKTVGGSAVLGPVWFWGWLFTIGYLKLSFMQGALALILWPYDLGVFFRR